MLPAGLFQGALVMALVLLFLTANQPLPLNACAVPWLPLLRYLMCSHCCKSVMVSKGWYLRHSVKPHYS